MKDDLITQIYNILSMGLEVADTVKWDGNFEYDHNIMEIIDINDDDIIIKVKDYDGDILICTLNLNI
jgi:hypothetical protein